jgi:hypothetical protein
VRAAVTFIIPVTRERHRERYRTLRSVVAQTDPDWLTVCCGAGFVPDLPLEARNFAIRAPENASLAELRNFGMQHLHLAAEMEQADSDWIGFLDEGDTVSEDFVRLVGSTSPEAADVVIVRAQDPDGRIMPDSLFPSLLPGDIDMNFLISRRFAQSYDIEFRNARDIPSAFVREALLHNARLLLLPQTAYFIEGTP